MTVKAVNVAKVLIRLTPTSTRRVYDGFELGGDGTFDPDDGDLHPLSLPTRTAMVFPIAKTGVACVRRTVWPYPMYFLYRGRTFKSV